jgi:hypothetical protein
MENTGHFNLVATLNGARNRKRFGSKPSEAIAQYDELIAKFGKAAELPLREQVAILVIEEQIEVGVADLSFCHCFSPL